PSPEGDMPPCPDGAILKAPEPEDPRSAQWCEKNGVKHGPYVTWYTRGHRESYATYVDGKRHGPAITWDPQARLEARLLYDHGRQISPEVWYEKGKKRAEQTWQEGDALPTHVTFAEDGSVRTTSALDCPPGTEKKIEKDIDLSNKDNDNDAAHRTLVTCRKGGAADGPYVQLYPGNALEVRGTFQRGVKEGLEEGFELTGEPLHRGQRAAGKRVGTWVFFYKKHKLKEEDYDTQGRLVADRFFDDFGKLKAGNYYDARGKAIQEWTGDTPPPRKK
ncbi:MAG TPA: hypothetical protein VN253_07090, partial [Kofleriaceae bacterium]|nr:hypothetical protein [Kofleriaceae bacterium]